VPPAIVGVLFLGDTTRRGLTGLAASGFFLAVASAVALARFGEAGEQDRPGSPDDTDTRYRRHSQATTSV
jgi:hypothetical protein